MKYIYSVYVVNALGRKIFLYSYGSLAYAKLKAAECLALWEDDTFCVIEKRLPFECAVAKWIVSRDCAAVRGDCDD